ncbi:hypothetical protein [Actinokineospora sp. NBRC 105648]|uniref:hypothetical protein n=1 Tax=Actinokineospora sp. NBRC 105648 TaxID=3032206 RepID=UPI0024A27D92|nr:hypothetical protein [Actinokineospora sp. NBRC 105648]GLZ41838.1 hypothetical protein Acsp05_54620 [Actinokineospora sp. NBRC 105648]
MAVFDAQWWGAWWPWLLVWVVTVAALVIAITIAVRHWRENRAPERNRRHGVGFYLDDEGVMALYRQYGGKYKAALRQEVQERISASREVELGVELAPVRAAAKRGVNSEVFRSYIENVEPITAIEIILDVLARAGDVVDVDLRRQQVVGGPALDNTLDEQDRPREVRLRDLETFVSLRGLFHATTTDAETSVFEAPYGDPADPAASPRIRLSCRTSGLRAGPVPTRSFPARCLGRVEDWDPETKVLTVHPIAIFR